MAKYICNIYYSGVAEGEGDTEDEAKMKAESDLPIMVDTIDYIEIEKN